MRLHLPAWLALTAFLIIQPGCITKRHIPVEPSPAPKAEPAPQPEPKPETVQQKPAPAQEEDLVVIPAMGDEATPQPAGTHEPEVSEVDLNGELQDLREQNGDVTAPAADSATSMDPGSASAASGQAAPVVSQASSEGTAEQDAQEARKAADLKAAAQETVEGASAEGSAPAGETADNAAPAAGASPTDSGTPKSGTPKSGTADSAITEPSDDMLAQGLAPESGDEAAAPVDTVVVAQGETVTETVTETDEDGAMETAEVVVEEESVVAAQVVPNKSAGEKAADTEVVRRGDILPEEGLAARISGSLEGRPTASGKVYSSGEMVAAHNTLPMGTRVLVENLDNGRSAMVIVIDRGPLVTSRVMDVSAAAARALGIPLRGTARVRLSNPDATAQPADKPAPQSAAAPAGAYYVQVGALAQTRSAQQEMARLKERGYVGSRMMTVEKNGTVWHRVQAGAFATADEARKAMEALSADYPGCFVYRD